jgi:hypothetical protein
MEHADGVTVEDGDASTVDGLDGVRRRNENNERERGKREERCP